MIKTAKGLTAMKKAFVIGVAGGSASGKSTFAQNLQETLCGLQTLTFNMDTYFKPPEERQIVKAPITGKPYRDDNHPSSFDLPKLRHDLDEALRDGHTQVIIIEGLLTLWDEEIYNKLDLRLFIDCQADERIVRRLRRNMKRGLTFDEIADVYLDFVRYRHDEYVAPTKWRADLIINGSNSFDNAIKIISSYVKGAV